MNKLLIFALVAGGLIFMSKGAKGDKRGEVRTILLSRTDNEADRSTLSNIVSRFTEPEVNTVHVFLTQYLLKNKQVPKDSQLYKDMTTIGIKYNIFT